MKFVNGWWIPDGDDEIHHPLTLEHDLKLFELIDKHSPGFFHAIDVGGNVGKWASRLAQSFNHVSVFEPADYHIDCFELNCKNYSNIKLYKYGLSDKDSKGNLNIAIPGHFGSTRIIENHAGNIEMKTLDSLNFEKIDMIKIDVEGRELHVLQGGEQTLKNHSPLIVIERCSMNSSAFGYSKKATHDILTEYGYKLIHKLTRDCIYKK